MEAHETEEDSGPKPNGEKETISSAEEDVGMTGQVGNVDPLLGYITWFTNVEELYQKKNCNCFRCGSPDCLVKDCLEKIGKTARKVGLNMKRGDGEEGRPVLLDIGGYPRGPFLNPYPLTHWSGPENIAQIKINGEGSWALLDSGPTINVVTLQFVKASSLHVGPLRNLVDGTLKINGFWELFSLPLGYVIIRVQVEGVKGHKEDEVALVIPDLAAFGS